MTPVPFQELRRIADALAALRGQGVAEAVMRSDLRQLRIETANGLMMVLTVGVDEAGRARLEVDVIRQPAEPRHQLEVRFDTA